MDLNSGKKLVKFCIWSTAFYGAEIQTFRKIEINSNVVKSGIGKGWRRSVVQIDVQNEDVPRRVNEEKTVIYEIRRKKAIRQQTGLEETIIKETEQNQLTWYGHVQRLAEERLPEIALKWMPKQKRARGRPKKNWMEGIKKAINERNLNEGQWEDRKLWKLGVGQRRKTF